MDDKSFDIAAIAVSSGVLIGYHAYLYLAVFLYMNDNIQLSTNMKNSIWWLKKHELKGDAPTVTLAIQTFRNTILVAIFVGGYTLQLAMSITSSSSGSEFRSIIIAALAFSSFLAWATVIRIASSLGYLIGTLDYVNNAEASTKKIDIEVDLDVEEGSGKTNIEKIQGQGSSSASKEDGVTRRGGSSRTRLSLTKVVEIRPPNVPKEAARMLQMMLFCVNLGFRLIFVIIPFAFYGSGPLALIISTALLLIFLIMYDFKFTINMD